MVGQAKTEGAGQRFSTYIGELRQFFESRGVAFGKPQDLTGFAQTLNTDESFQEEMGSMVRTILYQADERLGRGELLELVTTAVGGPDVDGSTAEVQGSIRQIFLFLNAAVRQGGRASSAPEFPEEEAVASSETRQGAQHPNPIAEAAPVLQRPVFAPATRQEPRSPSGNEVLFRAISLSAESEEEPQLKPLPFLTNTLAKERPRGPWWAIPAVGLLLAAIGAGVYVGRPWVERHAQGTATLDVTPSSSGSPSSCVAPIAAGVTRASLEERSRWAHNLLEQRLYEAALPELREIARLDPGYPGIKLDESDALLNLKRPEDSREAIDAQIGVSECLAKLPSAMLDTYCSAQFSIASVAGCRAQLTHIRQAAELQAALVHLELGHRVQPDPDAAASIADLSEGHADPPAKPTHPASPAAPVAREKHVEPLPPATEGDAALPPMAREPVSRGSKKTKGDASLVRGEGTDSVYGAYQKPE